MTVCVALVTRELVDSLPAARPISTRFDPMTATSSDNANAGKQPSLNDMMRAKSADELVGAQLGGLVFKGEPADLQPYPQGRRISGLRVGAGPFRCTTWGPRDSSHHAHYR